MRIAVARGDMPADLDEIAFTLSPTEAGTQVFHLRRTFRNFIALTGFKSRAITWFGHESWFGHTVLHWVLYALAAKPVTPASSEVPRNLL